MVLRGLTFEIALTYFDDIVVFASSMFEDLQQLSIVFQQFCEAGLINHQKNNLGWAMVQYLEHQVSAASISPDLPKPLRTRLANTNFFNQSLTVSRFC